MKNLFTCAIAVICCGMLSAQNPCVSFDGVDDYVNLGSEVGDNARTIEFWFSTSELINPQLDEFKALVVREISLTNEFEWDIHFVRQGVNLPAGTIRFTVHETINNRHEIFSNSNTWLAGQWHHLAVVIDPELGMMMFVDGIKQDDTLPSYTLATSSHPSTTELGRWGSAGRHFNGKIDDLRISTASLYTEDFNPLCPDVAAESNTSGVWNFNEDSGQLALDGSSNGQDAQLEGATWADANICGGVVNTLELESPTSFSLYPNPTSAELFIDLEEPGSNVTIINALGEIQLHETENKAHTLKVDLSHLASGIYYVKVQQGTNSEVKRFIKQ